MSCTGALVVLAVSTCEMCMSRARMCERTLEYVSENMCIFEKTSICDPARHFCVEFSVHVYNTELSGWSSWHTYHYDSGFARETLLSFSCSTSASS